MPKYLLYIYIYYIQDILYTAIGFFNDTFLVDNVSSMTNQVATRASCQLPCARRADTFSQIRPGL